jgi:hypothetical protein
LSVEFDAATLSLWIGHGSGGNMIIRRSDIKEGMLARSSDGEKLGKVFAVGDEGFHIEKGMFFPKDYLVRFSHVSDIRNGEIYLTQGTAALKGLFN